MPLTRRLAVVALIAVLGGSRAALAVCSKTLSGPTCSAASIVSDPNCCGAASCNLDGMITVNAPTCDLDFAGRNVTLSGTLVVGPNTVTMETGSLEVSGLLDASGHTSPAPAGNVTITADGGLSLTGGAATGIDVSGFGTGGGTLTVNAGGSVFMAGGSITANGLDPDSSGGSISITSTTCSSNPCMTVGVQVQANSQPGTNGIAFGGSVALEAPGDITITDSGRIQAQGGSGDGGSVLLMAAGAVSMTTGAQIQADALGTSAGSGGDVEIDAASISIQGFIEVKGGTDVTEGLGGDGGTITLEAFTGPLSLMRTTAGLTADGAGGGNGGDVTLTTDSPGNGAMTIAAPVSVQGFGGAVNRFAGGGSIEVSSATGLTVTKSLNVSGVGGASGAVDLTAFGRDVVINNAIQGADPAGGGEVSIDAAHDVIVANIGSGSSIKMNGQLDTQNDPAPGGEILITAGNDLTITGFLLDTSGAGQTQGGQILLESGRHLTIDRQSTLNGSGGGVAGGSGGTVKLDAGMPDLAGNLRVDGDVFANGRSTTSPNPGSIELSGCTVTIGGTARLDSTGDTGSANVVTGRTSITINGKLLATGSNTANYPAGTPPTVSGSNAQVSPAFGACAGGCGKPLCTAVNTPPGCLTPCRTCGDHTVEFPEQCDPPGCPTCDIHCRTIQPAACNDRNACTADSCDPVFGCINEPVADGTACDDANACTTGDTCQGGSCVGGPAPSCDDGNVCTNDACDAATGCTHTPVVCPDDSNRCNGAETCTPPGGCHHGTLVTCPSGLVCNPATGTCEQKLCSTGADCDDGNPCTIDTCSSGACSSVARPNGLAPGCTDSDACNGSETCQAGVCTPGTPLDCDDGNPCTDDSCDSVQGCVHAAVVGCCRAPADCPGSNSCTSCVNNACGVLANCCAIDADCTHACATSSCQNHQCSPPNPLPFDGTSCANGTVCDGAEICQGGTCMPGTPLNCPPSGDVCVQAVCDPVSGCTARPIEGCCHTDAECNDNDTCTTDLCDADAHVCSNNPIFPGCRTCSVDTECDPAGACGQSVCGPQGYCLDNSPPECTDGNCDTADTCVVDGPGAGNAHCEHQPGQCINACNGKSCDQHGSCIQGTPPSCDDGDPCTDDGCNPATGCTNTPRTSFASVGCRFDAMDAAIRGASVHDLAPPAAAKLEKLIGKARVKLAAAQSAGHGKRAVKALKVVAKQLKAIGRVVRAAQKKHQIAAPVANVIQSAASGGSQALETLKASVTP